MPCVQQSIAPVVRHSIIIHHSTPLYSHNYQDLTFHTVYRNNFASQPGGPAFDQLFAVGNSPSLNASLTAEFITLIDLPLLTHSLKSVAATVSKPAFTCKHF